MTHTSDFDVNHASTQVKLAIKGLMEFASQDNQDDVAYAANKLNAVLRAVYDNCHAWSREAIREFVLNKNDPLRYIDIHSNQFNRRVRTIQEDMILKFS